MKGPRVNKKQHLADDVAFIFSECDRVNKLALEHPKKVPKDDIWYTLPHPSGSGAMICGRQAWERLNTLAQDAAKRAGLMRRIELDTIRKPLERILVARFLTEARAIDVAQVERALSAAGKEAQTSCQNKTHLIPCHLMHVTNAGDWQVGPVTFRSRQSFRRLVAPKVRVLRVNGDPQYRSIRRNLLLDTIKYYNTFEWWWCWAALRCWPISGSM